MTKENIDDGSREDIGSALRRRFLVRTKRVLPLDHVMIENIPGVDANFGAEPGDRIVEVEATPDDEQTEN